MKYLFFRFDETMQGVEEVLIAIKKLRDQRGLLINIEPKIIWVQTSEINTEWLNKST